RARGGAGRRARGGGGRRGPGGAGRRGRGGGGRRGRGGGRPRGRGRRARGGGRHGRVGRSVGRGRRSRGVRGRRGRHARGRVGRGARWRRGRRRGGWSHPVQHRDDPRGGPRRVVVQVAGVVVVRVVYHHVERHPPPLAGPEDRPGRHVDRPDALSGAAGQDVAGRGVGDDDARREPTGADAVDPGADARERVDRTVVVGRADEADERPPPAYVVILAGGDRIG